MEKYHPLNNIFLIDRSPLPKYVEIEHTLGYPSLSDPDMFHIPIETPATNNSASQHQSSYLSFAPPEVYYIPQSSRIDSIVDW